MKAGKPCQVLALGLAIAAAFMLGAQAPQPTHRLRATAPISFYVAPDGIDSTNDCLVKTSPCATAQHAISRAMYDWDFAGQEPFIRLAPGTYKDTMIRLVGQPLGAHTVNIVGQQSEDQGCTQPQAEQVILGGIAGSPIFYFQDPHPKMDPQESARRRCGSL